MENKKLFGLTAFQYLYWINIIQIQGQSYIFPFKNRFCALLLSIAISGCVVKIYEDLKKFKSYARKLALYLLVPYYTIILPLILMYKMNMKIHYTDDGIGIFSSIISVLAGFILLFYLFNPKVKEQFK
jgi:polyferredoxin